VATRRRTITNDSRKLDGDQRQPPPRAASRDLSPVIRHDFVSSPWKRFRPSTDHVRQPPPRRPLFASSRNSRDLPATDDTRLSTAIQNEQSRGPPATCAASSGSTVNTDMARCTGQHHPVHLLSNMSTFVDFQDLPLTRGPHRVESHRPLNVRSRRPGFSIKVDSRFDMASSTGLYFFIVSVVCRNV